ncbi:MAG: SirB1 family protein [Polyangiales bacterium]
MPAEVMALLICRDEYPTISLQEELARLDALAQPLCAAADKSPEVQAQCIASYIYDKLGFHGNEQEFYDPRNSYLCEVVTRRSGIPITLAVLLMGLGRRAGIAVEGIGFPGHFLIRVGGEDGVLVDPFYGGQVLTSEALHRLATRFLGSPSQLRKEHLVPVGVHSIAVRMLINLKHVYERRGDHARSLVICDRLVDLTASSSFRRDRGLHALALGAAQAAAADFEAYLGACPRASDASTIQIALRRANAAGNSPVAFQ